MYECLLFLQAAAKILQQAHSIPGMEITYYGSFSENTVSAFDQIYNSEVRIILGMFGEEFAQSVLCMVRLCMMYILLLHIANDAALVLLQEWGGVGSAKRMGMGSWEGGKGREEGKGREGVREREGGKGREGAREGR